METIREFRKVERPSRLSSCKKTAGITDNRSGQIRQAKLIAAVQSGRGTVQRDTIFQYGPKQNLNYTVGVLNHTTQVATEAHAWISPHDPKHGTTTPPRTGAYADFNLIQGHLINANLGGVGEEYNLFPITASMNAQHKNNIEIPVKSQFLYLYQQRNTYPWQNRHLHYYVKANNPYLANFNGHESDTTFECKWGYTNEHHQDLQTLGMGNYIVSDAHNIQNQVLDAQLVAAGMGATPHNMANQINIVGTQLFRGGALVGNINLANGIIILH